MRYHIAETFNVRRRIYYAFFMHLEVGHQCQCLSIMHALLTLFWAGRGWGTYVYMLHVFSAHERHKTNRQMLVQVKSGYQYTVYNMHHLHVLYMYMYMFPVLWSACKEPSWAPGSEEKVGDGLKLWSQLSYSFSTVVINHNQPQHT